VDPRKVWPIELAKQVLRGKNKAFAPTHKAFSVSDYARIVEQGGSFEIEEARRVGLLSLISMGGLDALRLSRFLGSPERVTRAFVKLDQLAFSLPGVSRAGLNLVIRARRA
jgi:hypothetical protein